MAEEGFYLGYFGLAERPFSLRPDPDFLFWSEQHRRADAMLEFGCLSHATVMMLTGEIGAGKTTLVQRLIAASGTDRTVGLIAQARGDGPIMDWILAAFDIDPGAADAVARHRGFEEFVIAEYAAGRRVLLIVDEAQNLSETALETLRLLSNINAGKDDPLQILLVGQPELRETVGRPGMRQLAQRIGASCHLGALDAESVAAYIAHRLRSAGGSGREFTPGAAELVHAYTGGIPRLVNQLCDFGLLYAWTMDQRRVTDDVLRAVLAEGACFGARPRLEAVR